MTLSSDGNGSQPLFDAAGNLTGIGVAGFESLLETLQTLVNHYGFSLTDALRPLTTSVAAFLSLDGKGEIRPGNDADLLVFSADLRIEQVYARGKRMVNEKACVKVPLNRRNSRWFQTAPSRHSEEDGISGCQPPEWT